MVRVAKQTRLGQIEIYNGAVTPMSISNEPLATVARANQGCHKTINHSAFKKIVPSNAEDGEKVISINLALWHTILRFDVSEQGVF